MIKISNLTVAFEGRTVIDGIDLTVEEGESLVLLGKNGSGKSVILKAVAGLLDYYGGNIRINSHDTAAFFRDRDRGAAGGLDDFRLAYVFQKGGLFDSMNVFDNVAFGLRRLGVSEDEAAALVRDSLARVGLRGSDDKIPSELSGGMQKRVGLARAVCMNPNIILYDDPTAGLDPILSDAIADLILEIRSSLSASSITVTHDLKVAEKIADRIALLYNGKIVFCGTGAEFMSGKDPHALQFIQGETEGPIDMY